MLAPSGPRCWLGLALVLVLELAPVLAQWVPWCWLGFALVLGKLGSGVAAPKLCL